MGRKLLLQSFGDETPAERNGPGRLAAGVARGANCIGTDGTFGQVDLSMAVFNPDLSPHGLRSHGAVAYDQVLLSEQTVADIPGGDRFLEAIWVSMGVPASPLTTRTGGGRPRPAGASRLRRSFAWDRMADSTSPSSHPRPPPNGGVAVNAAPSSPSNWNRPSFANLGLGTTPEISN